MATMRNSAFGSRHVYPGFGGSLVLRSGFLCPVDWVRALTCLVPVLTCAAPRFLQGGDIQCFCEMMALLLLAGKMDFDNATFQLWLMACHTPKLE